VSRLILINGAPASGKSTLAKRYAVDHALALVLDIDEVRAMLGRWLDAPSDAGRLARRLAIAMARTHLTSGYDVVVPQLLGRPQFLHELAALSEEVGVRFVEIVLVSNPDEAVARFIQRSEQGQLPTHRDAKALMDSRGEGSEELQRMYAAVMAVVADRPNTKSIRTVDGEIEQAYQELLGHVED
jgi:predicted kinase